MSNYLQNHLTRSIPQTEQADPLQVPNTGGGFSFQVSSMDRLMRFLILGSEGGTYYIGEKDLTKQNLDNLRSLTSTAPKDVIDLAAQISDEGRSYRNDAAVFVLAFVMTNGSEDAKVYARSQMGRIVRTSYHLFQFESFLKTLATGSGLGSSRNKAIASWYLNKTPEQIAYQAVKYRQRNGWTHRDSLRQSRPNFFTDLSDDVAKWILGKYNGNIDQLPAVIQGFEYAQNCNDVGGLLKVLDDYKMLPWEALPTQFLKEPKVWKKLFGNGQLKGQALVRNITRLARIKAFDDLVFAGDYAKALTDEQMIAQTRLHPLNYLNALVVHTDGQKDRKGFGKVKDWNTVPVISQALDAGIHLAFKHIEPTNKRTLLALDVSSSMSWAVGMGLDLTAAQVSGVMATAIAKTEPYHQIMGFAHTFKDLGIHAGMDLMSVMRAISNLNFGSTNCALPFTWAAERGIEIDTFVVITDNETNTGNTHPHIALQHYRRKTGIPARLVVVGVTANNFTIADPNDSGMLDVVGADANLPKLIAEFSKGKI